MSDINNSIDTKDASNVNLADNSITSSPTNTKWKSPFPFRTFLKYNLDSQHLFNEVVTPLFNSVYKFLYSSENSVYNFLINNRITRIPKKIILNSNDNKIIKISLSGDNSDSVLSNLEKSELTAPPIFTITPKDRKKALILFTSLSTLFHYFYFNYPKQQTFKFRLSISYFFIYSILVYREALNPYIYY